MDIPTASQVASFFSFFHNIYAYHWPKHGGNFNRESHLKWTMGERARRANFFQKNFRHVLFPKKRNGANQSPFVCSIFELKCWNEWIQNHWIWLFFYQNCDVWYSNFCWFPEKYFLSFSPRVEARKFQFFDAKKYRNSLTLPSCLSTSWVLLLE